MAGLAGVLPHSFWKQGYWKNHLRGKPYHISALFVVDLDRVSHFQDSRRPETLITDGREFYFIYFYDFFFLFCG